MNFKSSSRVADRSELTALAMQKARRQLECALLEHFGEKLLEESYRFGTWFYCPRLDTQIQAVHLSTGTSVFVLFESHDIRTLHIRKDINL